MRNRLKTAMWIMGIGAVLAVIAPPLASALAADAAIALAATGTICAGTQALALAATWSKVSELDEEERSREDQV